jgi:hypothetical protein
MPGGRRDGQPTRCGDMLLRPAPLHSCEQDPSVRVGLPFAFNHYLHMPDHLYNVTTNCMLCFLARRGALPHLSRSLYPPSPPNGRRHLRIFDPHLAKDLRLFHILDGSSG